MPNSELAILELFRRYPNNEYSTTEIVKAVEPEEYNKINTSLQDKYTTSVQRKQAKRLNAQLHRKILYYLNKLVLDDVLRVSREGGKGEKFFSLTIGEGEEITLAKIRKRPITIVKPKTPTMPIEGYEQRGIICRLEAPTWIDRLNSILIECGICNDILQLQKLITTCFAHINDAICLNNFEKLIPKDLNKAINFLSRLETQCADYGKHASIIIDMTNVRNSREVLAVINYILEAKLHHMDVIFDVTSKEFQAFQEFFEKIIKIYAKTKANLYIKNQGLHRAPYILGRAGPYTFDEISWTHRYKRELLDTIPYVVCGQSTVLVDMERLFQEEGRGLEQAHSVIEKIMNSLLVANSMQRAHCTEYFESLIKVDERRTHEYFMFGRNYIRFWNYGWKRQDIDQQFVTELFRSTKKMVDKFCLWEDTIYKSCGMPTRFKVAFSCAFDEFTKNIFTPTKYKRIYINDIKDFYKPEIKEILSTKEKIVKYFDGGDLFSLYKTGTLDVDEVLREIAFVLSSYNIPLFRLNFTGAQYHTLTLDRFYQ